MTTTIHLTVGETMFLRVVGNRYYSGEEFNSYTVRDTIDNNNLIKKMSNKLLDSICNELTNKGLFTCIDRSKHLYSLTVFGVSCYEAIVTKITAGRARCASGRNYNGEKTKSVS